MTAGTNHTGARWWKFDLHTHTPASSDTYWAKEGAELSPETWLRRWMLAEIDCVAITDHNSGAWIDRLKTAYETMCRERAEGFRELAIFPGVEISVSGGFHLLAILDPSSSTSDIDTLLGNVDFRGKKGDTEDVTEASAKTVVDAVVAAGGLAIPAHVDSPKGLLECAPDSAKALRDAGMLRQVLAAPNVFACEVVDVGMRKPAVYEEANPKWTEVLGSDCHSFQGANAPGSRFTWIKMARPSLEGLRLALLDGPGFSVRRSDMYGLGDPNVPPDHFIEELSISEARVMGRGQPETIRFSPWFNAIVGGRGTGKSTVVHALRLAFRRNDEIKSETERSEPAHVFAQFCRISKGRDEIGGLTEKTEVQAVLCRDGVRHRLRWRQDGQGPVVEDSEGAGWRASTTPVVSAERFPLRIFSQGQIAELARSGHRALLALIDETADAGPAKRALEDARLGFLRLRARERELDAKLIRREQVVVSLEDVKRKLAAFEAGNSAAVLKRYQTASRQERELHAQLSLAGQLADRLEGMAASPAMREASSDLFAGDGSATTAARACLGQIHKAVADAENAIRTAARGLRDAVECARNEVEQSVWRTKVDEAKGNFESLMAGLKAQGVQEPNEYGNLVAKRQDLEKELAVFDALSREKDALSLELRDQLVVVREARRNLSGVRRAFLERSLAANDYVRISLVPYGRDSRSIEQSLRDALNVGPERFANDILVLEEGAPRSGLVAELGLALPDDYEGRMAEIEKRLEGWQARFKEAASGRGTFGAHFRNHLQRESERRPEFVDRVLVYAPEDELEVRYSQRGDGKQFRPIEQASAGQQAAAMLAFLLAHGREPIVLDQPEDDLDNHLIYDLVVRQIRENKLRRQVIVVTHNPNIVVNGDAEMVQAFDFRGGTCRVMERGCLQDKKMRDEVCRVMEGGREAFERRYQRLGGKGGW